MFHNRAFLVLALVCSLILAGIAFAGDGPALTVNVAAGRHAISPDVYGMNNYAGDRTAFLQGGVTVQRSGGNATSRYNWLVDSSNSGHDWFYIGGSGTPADQVTPGASMDDMVAFDKTNRLKSVMTIPLIGYVNKYSEWNCSYWDTDYPEYGPQWGWIGIWPYFPEMNGHYCGSGLDPNYPFWEDVQLPAKDIMRNHIAVDASWMRGWIDHLVATHGSASVGGVQIYQMDNEPESWNYIHYDVHPDGTGFDEVLGRTLAYGSMIKGADPTAKILGPSNWGPPAYWNMNKDNDDQWSHDGTPWYQYYLTNLKTYEQANGVRLLDYFDQHFYPSVDGVDLANTTVGGDDAKKARLRSTRVLWDPTYNQENWMGTWYPDTYGKLMLIPRMRQWVNIYYPGTKTSITEYNWGGLEDINGALAQADVLGIFGREGLDLATLWGPPTADQPGVFAFKMYRDYDGKGSKYGDTWVESASADQGQLAIYGAQRSTDSALTMVVINKTDDDLASPVVLQNFMPDKQFANVYRYSAANLQAIVNVAPAMIQKINGTGYMGVPDSKIVYTFPANSITLMVVPGHLIPGAVHVPGTGKPGTGIQRGTVPPETKAVVPSGVQLPPNNSGNVRKYKENRK